jgi:hypothetical protein
VFVAMEDVKNRRCLLRFRVSVGTTNLHSLSVGWAFTFSVGATYPELGVAAQGTVCPMAEKSQVGSSDGRLINPPFSHRHPRRSRHRPNHLKRAESSTECCPQDQGPCVIATYRLPYRAPCHVPARKREVWR